MNQNNIVTINYSVKKVSGDVATRSGGRPLFWVSSSPRFVIKADDFSSLVAKKMNGDSLHVRYFIDALAETIEEVLNQGGKVDLGWIAFEPKLAKAVEAQDAGFDPENVTVRIRPSRRFRNCIRNVVYRNENDPDRPLIYSVVEGSQFRHNTFKVAGELIKVNGQNLMIVSGRQDEGVWLEDSAGAIVVRARIVSSDHATCDFVFEQLPPKGCYRLVIAGRDGRPESYRVLRATHNVQIVG